MVNFTFHNPTRIEFTLSLFRNDFPWIYDSGLDLVRVLRSKELKGNEKDEVINDFMQLIEFTFEHPMMREVYGMDKELYMMGRELRHILMRSIENIIR